MGSTLSYLGRGDSLGEGHHEAGTPTHRFFHPDGRSVTLGKLSHHREADPGPGYSRLSVPLQTGIGREDLPSLIRGDPFTLVLHQKLDGPGSPFPEPHVDDLAFRSVLDGILQEVEEDLPECGRVHPCPKSLVQRGLYPAPPGFGQWEKSLQNL